MEYIEIPSELKPEIERLDAETLENLKAIGYCLQTLGNFKQLLKEQEKSSYTLDF